MIYCKLASNDKISGFLDTVNFSLNDFSNPDIPKLSSSICPRT